MSTTLPLEGSAGELRSRIAGDVHTAGDASFDELRRPWNRAYEHRPALLVEPTSAADVAAAVNHAAALNMTVTIETTGHGVTRPAAGSMLLRTHRLTDVTVDGEAWTARIGGGARWADVLGPATSAGLAPLLGSTPEVGAVGYTLGGGMGWLARKYGLAADHVRAIEIVTADGQIRRSSPESDPDLFWALRGAGAGSLGVVTAMEIDLAPVQRVYAGNLYYPAAMARDVGRRFREWVASVPDEVTSAFTLMNFPDVDGVATDLRGRSFALIRGAFTGSEALGAELLDFWRSWRPPTIDAWGTMPISDIGLVSNDPAEPVAGLATSEYVDDLADDVIEILVTALFERGRPSHLVSAELRHAGGAIARPPVRPSAIDHRNRRHVLQFVGTADTPRALAELHASVADMKGKLSPHLAGGAYLNFLEGDEKIARSRTAFTPETWKRLKSVKKGYDPTNLFSNGVALA